MRDAIDDCSQLSGSFDEFQSLLLDRYNISVIEKRGSYRYLHPDRDRRISSESLGGNYGKEYLEQQFQNHFINKSQPHESSHNTENAANLDYNTDSFIIFYVKSELRLVTDLQTNVKAMQNQAYARKVKISNLQQMADTLIYIQDHGYDTREDLKKQETDIRLKMEEAQEHLSDLYLIGLIFFRFPVIMVEGIFPYLPGTYISPGVAIQPPLNLSCHGIFLHELFPVFIDLHFHFL